MADQKENKKPDSEESSKKDQPTNAEVQDNELNQVSGGFSSALLGRCGVCGKPKNECICPVV